MSAGRARGRRRRRRAGSAVSGIRNIGRGRGDVQRRRHGGATSRLIPEALDRPVRRRDEVARASPLRSTPTIERRRRRRVPAATPIDRRRGDEAAVDQDDAVAAAVAPGRRRSGDSPAPPSRTAYSREGRALIASAGAARTWTRTKSTSRPCAEVPQDDRQGLGRGRPEGRRSWASRRFLPFQPLELPDAEADQDERQVDGDQPTVRRADAAPAAAATPVRAQSSRPRLRGLVDGTAAATITPLNGRSRQPGRDQRQRQPDDRCTQIGGWKATSTKSAPKARPGSRRSG